MSLHAQPSPDAHPPLADHERTPCEVWTRVMGYHRPVASFNIGKRGEHAERQSFVATPAPAPTPFGHAAAACA